MSSLLVVLVLSFYDFPGFDASVTLDPVPEDAGEFLQAPRDLVVDSKGRIHVVDLTAKTVFVWNPDGSFLTRYGSAGQGPGEFVFQSQFGGTQGYISEIDGKFYIYDGGARQINVFNADLEFEKAINFQLEAGRVEKFQSVDANRFLVFYSSYFSEVPFRKIALYDNQKQPLHEYIQAKDNTWEYLGSANNRKVLLHVYGTQLTMDYDPLSGGVILGDSAKPSFDIYNLDGKLERTVSMKITRREVTDADKEEWNEQSWFKNQAFFKADFPDRMPHYDHILPVADKGYLVFIISPGRSHCEGFKIKKDGAVAGRFELTCGAGGRLLGSMGRIFALTTDEDGEFVIAELNPKF